MKYLIHTSSGDIPSIEGIEKVQVHYYTIIGKDCNLNYWGKKCRDFVEKSQFCYRATYIEPEDTWLIDIDDLYEFVNQCGTSIILSKPQCEEGYWDIEIYDSYRE